MNAFLEGSLEGLPLSSVIRLLAENGREGLVRIGGPERSAELHLRSGPRFAMRCDDPDFQLPALLVRREVISEADGAKLQAAMQASGGALENSEQFSAEELRNFGRLQATEILIDALSWEYGQFRWTDEQTMPAGLGLFELDLDGAEKEAARRSAEAATSMKPAAGTRFIVMPRAFPPSMTLSAEELRLLLAIGHGSTFGEIEGDEQETSRLIHRLRVRGFIEEAPAGTEGAPPVAAEPLAGPEAPALAAQEEPRQAEVPEPVPAAQPPSEPMEPPFISATTPDIPYRRIDPTALDMPLEAEERDDTAEDAELPFAVLTLDDDSKTSFPLLDDQTSIGRGEHNIVRIVHGSISSTHARVDRTPAGYQIEDLKSRNGTFVNGDRIETALLKNNDRIRLGTVYVTFSVAAELEPSATVMTKLPPR